MKFIVFASLLVAAAAAPSNYLPAPPRSYDIVEIIRDDRVNPERGNYFFDVETGDGIKRTESGKPLPDVKGNPTGQQGAVSFTFPDGQHYDLKFVADGNGFQPQSSWIPVAPKFPHPVPQHALEQIAKAAREDAEGIVYHADPPRNSYYD